MDDERRAAGLDVLALVTSAGGLGALTAVLRSMPADLPAAVVVQQHLGSQGSALVPILQRRTVHEVVWAVDGAALVAGQVTVCPPRMRMEVLPDGTCAVTDNGLRARTMPHDALLTSVADAYAPRCLGVVLTGMGRDGAAGAAAITAAGGVVIAQSADTAEHESMPRAAAPAADLVLPLAEIGRGIADVVHGKPLPRPRSEIEAADRPPTPTRVRAIPLRRPDGTIRGWLGTTVDLDGTGPT